MDDVNPADAKARLSEPVERVAAGHPERTTRCGRRVARITAAAPPRRPINPPALRAR